MATTRLLGPELRVRLLDLQSGLEDAPLVASFVEIDLENEPADYEALSYCWGAPEYVAFIYVDGREIPLQRNLTDALLHLRLGTESRLLWIDALCINQADTEEKAHQVRHMHLVYRKARRVLSWVGLGDESVNIAFDGLRKLASLREINWNDQQMEEALQISHDDLFRYALEELDERPYWGRAWVVQELVFATDCVLISGQHTISFGDMSRGLANMEIKDKGPTSPHIAQMILNVRKIGTRYGGNRKSLLENLYNLRVFQATDPRDKVYAFVNLPAAERLTPVDISYTMDPRNLDVHVSFNYIRGTGKLDILSYANLAASRPGFELEKDIFGTWVAWWTYSEFAQPRPLIIGSSPDAPIYFTAGGSSLHPPGHSFSQPDDNPNGYFRHDPVQLFKNPATEGNLLVPGYRFARVQSLSRVIDPGEVTDPGSDIHLECATLLESLGPDNRYATRPINRPRLVLHMKAEVDSQLQHHPETDMPQWTGNSIQQSWSLPQHMSDPELASIEAVWRTLCADKCLGEAELRSNHDPNRPYGRITEAAWIQYCVWHGGKEWGLEGLDLRNQAFHVFDTSLLEGAALRMFMVTTPVDEGKEARTEDGGSRDEEPVTEKQDDVEPVIERRQVGESHDEPSAAKPDDAYDQHKEDRGGYIGLAPPGAQDDDLIIIAIGSQTPLVLRETGESILVDNKPVKTWQLVGDCYVHGIMDGEFFHEVCESEAEVFVIV